MLHWRVNKNCTNKKIQIFCKKNKIIIIKLNSSENNNLLQAELHNLKITLTESYEERRSVNSSINISV